MKPLIKKNAFIPVLAAFFVMGFCDVVGVSVSYVKQDFNLSETVAGFLPSMVFVWFLFLAVPFSLLMNKKGRKWVVQMSNIITFVGMLLPLAFYNFTSCALAFAMLGIGNAMLQVSLNPLLTDVVNGDKLTSSLTVGQVIKAVSSFCGPFIAMFASMVIGNWKYLFLIYALITAVIYLLLAITGIEEKQEKGESTSVGKVFALLKDRTILLLFLGIVFVVGVDVGTNTVSAKLLIERCGMVVEKAGLGASVYFICRTAGALIGAALLAKFNEIKYFRINIALAAIFVILLFFAPNQATIYIGLGGVGFFCSSIFSIIFSLALKARPDKANEISGLMVTGIVGGAVVPPLMGAMTSLVGNQCGSLIVIAACVAYLIFCSFATATKKVEA